MRRSALASLLVLTTAPALAASGGGKVAAGPAGIAFSCSDTRALRAFYEDGSQRATVRLEFDGGETRALSAAPTPFDRRYEGSVGGGQILVWVTDGTGASLRQMTLAGPETEVARCQRAGWDGVVHDASHETEKH